MQSRQTLAFEVDCEVWGRGEGTNQGASPDFADSFRFRFIDIRFGAHLALGSDILRPRSSLSLCVAEGTDAAMQRLF